MKAGDGGLSGQRLHFRSGPQGPDASIGRNKVKKIEAIIRPEKLESVKSALSDAGIKGLTVTHVTGRGRQRTLVRSGRATRGVETDMLQRLKIEVFIDADAVEQACLIIREAASTGQVGDGKIFTMDVESAVRIRTGETGQDAL